MKTWRVAGINFDHMHMGDNLRMVYNHPRAEIVGICHEERERMQDTIEKLNIHDDRIFSDVDECIEKTQPDFAILCPATAKHGEYTQRVAAHGIHILIEKPFAASLAEADAMIEACKKTGRLLAINWPLAWEPCYVTAKRMIDEGKIGEVLEVHHYGGNRGPLFHVADKDEVSPEEVQREKNKSWFFKKAHGGGSMLDYLGYGVTLGTWFQGCRSPIEVTATVDQPIGLEVDEHSVTIARYEHGLSKFETRWGTFTDPWVYQPQPKCGFVITGTKGTIAAYDYEKQIRLQTVEHPEGFEMPVDKIEEPLQNPVQYMIHCLENDKPIEGILSPDLCRIGQQIIDSAVQSAAEKRTVPLVE